MIHSLNEFVVRLLGEGGAYLFVPDLTLKSKSSTDKRVEDWPLVRSPVPTLALCLSYVTFVKLLGPWLMRDRKPFSIRWLMVAYNLTMVVVSTWIFVMLGVYGWFGKYNYCCQPVDYSNSRDAIGVSSLSRPNFHSLIAFLTDGLHRLLVLHHQVRGVR